MKKAGMAFLVLALCGCGADQQASAPPRPEPPARREAAPAPPVAPPPAVVPEIPASPEPAAGIPTNGPVVTAPGPVASLPPIERRSEPCPEVPLIQPEPAFASLGGAEGQPQMEPMEGVVPSSIPSSIQVTPRTARSLAMPTLAEWHEGYREASLPTREALSRVVPTLRSGQLPDSSDCQALAESARQARPSLHAPDTRISGSLDEAYETLADLGDACAQGHQIGSVGLLQLAERRLDKAATALRRYGLEP